MPRKPTTTREDMIEAAFRLIREQGHEALTARNLAAALGCSTQPIMYQFPNLAELRELVYQRADRFHSSFILAGDDLLQIALNYIRFAAEEGPLFRFLFQSGHFDGMTLAELIRRPETEELLAAVSEGLKLPPDEAAAVFEPLYAAVHGYACLVASNAMPYDPAAIENALTAVAEGLVNKGEKPC